ncbi:MAG: FKBP-type peptidyl-prolyl cis-trans isomerase [Candidatus Woesearchaeota archaeon]
MQKDKHAKNVDTSKKLDKPSKKKSDSKVKDSKPVASGHGDATSKIVETGHLVHVEYAGTLDDGEEFDSSKNNGPISFIVGGGQVIKGFDDAVKGMKLNESKKFKVLKGDAYGDLNPSLMHKVPLDKLPEDLRSQVKVGGFLVLQSPVGQQIPAKIKSIEDNEITLDLNHPLAGKDLTFDITIVDISIPTDEQRRQMNEHHNGHGHDGHDHECGCGDGECKDGECGDDDCCGGSCGCNH